MYMCTCIQVTGQHLCMVVACTCVIVNMYIVDHSYVDSLSACLSSVLFNSFIVLYLILRFDLMYTQTFVVFIKSADKKSLRLSLVVGPCPGMKLSDSYDCG